MDESDACVVLDKGWFDPIQAGGFVITVGMYGGIDFLYGYIFIQFHGV